MILPIESLRLISTGELAPTNHPLILNQTVFKKAIKNPNKRGTRINRESASN